MSTGFVWLFAVCQRCIDSLHLTPARLAPAARAQLEPKLKRLFEEPQCLALLLDVGDCQTLHGPRAVPTPSAKTGCCARIQFCGSVLGSIVCCVLKQPLATLCPVLPVLPVLSRACPAVLLTGGAALLVLERILGPDLGCGLALEQVVSHFLAAVTRGLSRPGSVNLCSGLETSIFTVHLHRSGRLCSTTVRTDACACMSLEEPSKAMLVLTVSWC